MRSTRQITAAVLVVWSLSTAAYGQLGLPPAAQDKSLQLKVRLPDGRVQLIQSSDRSGLVVPAGGQLRIGADGTLMVDPLTDDLKQVRVFRLRYAQASEASRMLANVYDPELKIAVDVRANSIVVVATARQLQQLEELIEIVDSNPARPAPAGQVRSVRIAWVVSGLREVDGEPLPENLKPIGKELESLGFTNPRLAAQLMVRSKGNARKWRCDSRVEIGTSVRLEASGGFYADQGGAPDLAIDIKAESEEGEQMCRVDSTISAPPGHPVVLAVNPIGKLHSAFVVSYDVVE